MSRKCDYSSREVPFLTRPDWLLLLLGLPEADGSAPASMDRVRVMKCLFVMSKRFTLQGDFYNFRPYNYGPFDDAVYRDAETLAGQGYIEQLPGRYVHYAALAPAVERAKQFAPTLNPDFIAYVREVRKWATTVDFSTLVKAIYTAWPETRVNSIFQG